MSAPLPPWQERALQHGCEAYERGQLGHALLISGPARIGKREVADRLAQRIFCTQPVIGRACGQCRDCHMFQAGTHPDFRVVTFEETREGKLRTEIVIDQARDVGAWLALTPQFGGAQVVIVDPADAVNRAAANGLLKTLEEPLPGRYLWLVASDPMRLPATIRSRCQELPLRLPRHEEAVAWLAGQGIPAGQAEAALLAARGHPGLAAHWLREGGMALRQQVAVDLETLTKNQASPSAMAQQWAGDDSADARLRFAADLAVEQARSLTDPARTLRLGKWFDQANRVRALLRTTVRADLAITELLLAWRDAARPSGGQS